MGSERDEECRVILRLIASGGGARLNADDAARLLEALDRPSHEAVVRQCIQAVAATAPIGEARTAADQAKLCLDALKALLPPKQVWIVWWDYPPGAPLMAGSDKFDDAAAAERWRAERTRHGCLYAHVTGPHDVPAR